MAVIQPLQIVVVCHVEAGTSRNREIIYDRSREEGVTVALPRIVEFADRHGLPITFAMTPQSLRISQTDLDGYPVGLHLHPQDPILAARIGGSVSVPSDCLSDFPLETQSQLISAGIDEFVDAIGSPPLIFVAGNWSENNDTLGILERAGFAYDGSVLPGHESPCADWSRIPRLAQPYRPDPWDRQARGSGRLLYIPVFQGLWGHYLTPENLHFLRLAYFKAAFKEAVVSGATVVHMYFHSPMVLDPFYLPEFASVVEYAKDAVRADFIEPARIEVRSEPGARTFPPAYFAHLSAPVVLGLLTRRFAKASDKQAH